MRTIICAMLLLSVFSFSSCTKDVQSSAQSYVVAGTIRSSDWLRTTDGAGYYTSLSVPDVTNGVLNYGGVAVYLSFDGGYTYEALPEVVGGVAYGTYYSLGTVNIDLYAANGTGTVTNPPGGTVVVKVLITQP